MTLQTSVLYKLGIIESHTFSSLLENLLTSSMLQPKLLHNSARKVDFENVTMSVRGSRLPIDYLYSDSSYICVRIICNTFISLS